ncbi:Unknown protein, partial [Striga hermonthica]
VMATRGSSVNGLEKPQSSMASLLNMHYQTVGAPKNLRRDEDEQEMNLVELIQQPTIREKEPSKRVELGERADKQPKCQQRKTSIVEKEQEKVVLSNTFRKSERSKILVSPGSLEAYARMKKNSTTQKEPSTNIDCVSRRRGRLFDDVTGLGDSLAEENETYGSLHDYVSEETDNIEPQQIPNNAVGITNESLSMQEEHNLPVKKRTRGPSLCKDIHDRTIDNRLPIILNGLCQPIGPDKATLDKFSRFLGSLARDSNLAPLNEVNWTHVRDKDKIWEYVKKKFIIAEEGKTYVLQSIGALWRTYKSRVKKKYYYNSSSRDADGELKTIPDSHLKDLQKYWDLEEVQMNSQKKREASQSRIRRHTMGPIAFARKRHELQQADGKPPSLALMYKETHKRAPGRKYTTPAVNIELPESKDNGLLGRCSKRVKRPCKSDVLIPDEFLKPFKDEIVKDTLAGVLKIFERLPIEILNPINSSLENSLNVQELAKRLEEQSSGGINGVELSQ